MNGTDPKLLILLLTVTFIGWRFFRRRTGKSILDKIPGPPSNSFWAGNMLQFDARDGMDFQRHVALDYGSVTRMHGLFGQPVLYVSDPKALQTIILKEEHIFQEPLAFRMTNNFVFGPGLLSTIGETHRKQRKLLNPAFSTNHMRSILPIFYGVAHRLRDAISTQVKNGPEEVDILNWMSRTSLELIGQGGLGYSFDPLTENVQNEYGNAVKDLFPNLQPLSMFVPLVPLIGNIGPAWFRRSVTSLMPYRKIQRVISIVDTMNKRSSEIFNARKEAIRQGDDASLQQVGGGKDIMSLFIKANAATSEGDRLPDEELVAQMSTLVTGAVDTTSNALSRILYILAGRQDVQEKLRKEILEAEAGEGLSYDELDQLPILDSICRETLRVYPPAPTIFRQPCQDTVLPLSEPIVGTDGHLIKEIPIPKGTLFIVGIMGSNASKTLWGEDAREWKPERWLSPLPSTVTENPTPGIYSNMMTFIGGKRGCIGFKFSEMEIKVVLSALLSTFKFHLTEKPIEWNIAAVQYPTVGKDSSVPAMLLRVELLKS
ncbi:uncharacterized protein FIBRA_01773 [Fibroporia radiculosa]|uniref:Cytochrome P450 n=1 Tax=Fibroporia radiculosa TaxID=599839 RepID=J4I8P1_9APHY|nr:uncharacterized protein FIBRA_01773 [Fibroporia radiculosa]CCL99751.1 predicted protein [Fibroporia radiculosa]